MTDNVSLFENMASTTINRYQKDLADNFTTNNELLKDLRKNGTKEKNKMRDLQRLDAEL